MDAKVEHQGGAHVTGSGGKGGEGRSGMTTGSGGMPVCGEPVARHGTSTTRNDAPHARSVAELVRFDPVRILERTRYCYEPPFDRDPIDPHWQTRYLDR